ncbi:F0F1 ATP synthase subunit delta [Corynebacterium bovis]|uniref:F0F1 ATP synthase subunit delta n=1 Tax=Corynebacterium bovis TaxID=36808 RepID=UPI000F65350A|nr:F0F1 ATP synthase subunit delta [Corynebacterium bovis]RRO83899.1 F0F1 ATP synthase subunit delta [Corynebacterium bovis]RRO85100.1 F0F1 ATP synthase subunit delta [Corynebacterium bovis]
MHAASRDALDQLTRALDSGLEGSGDTVATGLTTGSELFEFTEVLDRERSLRSALVDASFTPEQRSGIVTTLVGGSVAPATAETLKSAVSLTWSTSRDLRTGLVTLGRRALLRAAQAQGQLDRVQDELFRLARIIDGEPQLELLLADRSASPDARRDLLAKVVYGKITAVTEALALQVIGRPQHRPVGDLDALCDEAAALTGNDVARVRSAAELNEQQRSSLAAKLETIYGHPITVRTEVDSSLLGGAVIRVGDEVIDGSTAGRLDRLRRSLA